MSVLEATLPLLPVVGYASSWRDFWRDADRAFDSTKTASPCCALGWPGRGSGQRGALGTWRAGKAESLKEGWWAEVTQITATGILRHEHDAILRMLDATEEVARMLDRGEQVSPEILTGLLEFFQLFADRCHHGKEEELLFPLLEKRGLPSQGGPLSVMLMEHEQGRWLIRELAAATAAYKAGDEAGRPCWAIAARGYARLLREHIFKENNVLFQIADRLLDDTEQKDLAAAFERIEEEKMGRGTHERLHGQMETLLAEISQKHAQAKI